MTGAGMTAVLRDLSPADIPRLVQLNDGAVPAVPPTDAAEFDELLRHADHAFGVIALPGTEPAGFVLAMEPGGQYASENYGWFENRGSDSLYVDRIVVDEGFRGAGLGRLLYDRVFELAASAHREEVTCEVNVEPPNPGSMRFHRRLGFTQVGRQATKGGAVVVALLAAPVTQGRMLP